MITPLDTANKPDKKSALAEKGIQKKPDALKKEMEKQYVVTIKTESLDIREIALLSDFEKYNITEDEESMMNEFISSKKFQLAQVLKDTKIRFKRKDDKIYLVARGVDSSSLVWTISN